MLVLYFAPGASSMAVHIALYEIGTPFDAKPISISTQENRSQEYLKINSEGKVPTLLIDGRPLTEVLAILFFLAQNFPEARLISDRTEEQAQALSWMSFIASTLHPARRRGIEYATEVYKIADRRLADCAWVTGRYSVADIHLFRLFWRFNSSLRPARNLFPRLFDHYDRMMMRPAVREVIAVEKAIGYELPA
jgi:glutathione S-transferase